MKKSLFLATLPLLATSAFAAKAIDLNIIHINDHHSHLEPSEVDMRIDGIRTKVKIGGYPEVVSVIKQLQKTQKNTLTLHAGDAITGTLYFTLFRGSADAEMMNLTSFDYFTLGNHEFDAGNEGLKKFLDYLKVPVISSNVIASKGSILENYWKPYGIKTIDGEKVAIIGLDVVNKTKESSSPGEDIIFTDEVETVRKYVNELQAKGINKIVVLSHAGANKNFEIAQKVDGVDIVITGDTHYLFGNDDMRKVGLNVFSQYPRKFRTPNGNPSYVVEGWEYSKLIGNLNIKFDKKGVITSIEGKPIIPFHLDSSFERRDKQNKKYKPETKEREEIISKLLATETFKVAKADPKAAKVLEKFAKEKKVLGDVVVGVIKGNAMPGGSANRIPNSKNPNGSVATRFIAETMLTQMRSFGENAHIDLTIQNSGGVRADINPGNMTFNDAYNLLPFGNTLFMFNMSGKEIKQVLEDALNFALGGNSTGAFPYGAGIRYEANQYKDANGNRLVKVEVQDATTKEWKEIDENKMYKVGTNNYIAGGKDGYVTFGKILKERGGEDTYLPDAESLIKFLQLNPDFETYTDSNVKFNFDAANPVIKK